MKVFTILFIGSEDTVPFPTVYRTLEAAKEAVREDLFAFYAEDAGEYEDDLYEEKRWSHSEYNGQHLYEEGDVMWIVQEAELESES